LVLGSSRVEATFCRSQSHVPIQNSGLGGWVVAVSGSRGSSFQIHQIPNIVVVVETEYQEYGGA
jgi:hypothetical protein